MQKIIRLNLLHKIKYVLISILLISCKETKGQEHKDTADRFEWSAGVSAPKFYPAAGTVNFGYAGAGQSTPFDPGWGNDYGSFVTGDRYKPIPEEVFIDYASATDPLPYKGTLKLPKEKILQIFKENQKDFYKTHEFNPYDTFNSKIIVGMAPGGWIRVWVRGNNDFQLKEVLKARLPSYQDPKLNKAYGDRNDWEEKSIYWQKHGVPYEAWAENEKEYEYGFKFVTKNKKSIFYTSNVVSKDGWWTSFLAEGTAIDTLNTKNNTWKGKIPVDVSISWKDSISGKIYDNKIAMPKTFEKLFKDNYSQNDLAVNSYIYIELEKNNKQVMIWFKTKKGKVKILRFTGSLSENKELFDDYPYPKEIEYFIK
ncbi:MAG: DUF2931 family protein [Cloacibacterium sp.]|nr:DUF2931 family protein [Cloacibacterium sp.]